MNFCWNFLDDYLEFDENHPGVLIIENPKAFTKLLQDLYELFLDGESACAFYENNSPIKADKRVELIIDPFSTDLNQRKVINALYSRLSKNMMEGEYVKETTELFSSIQTYLAHLISNVDYPVEFEQGVIGSEFFKAFNLHLETDEETLIQKLESYIKAAHEFLGKDVFFFVNLHAYISLDELKEFYKSAAYNKCKLFLIEAFEAPVLESENRIILDSSLCQLNFTCKPKSDCAILNFDDGL